MSETLEPELAVGPCAAAEATPCVLSLPSREARLGADMVIRRALPQRQRRTVGPWCFLDHFGPAQLSGRGMDVAAHPHIGLQTVTWLLAGEVLHKDDLGSQQLIRPGQLNLMTAGRGITHSEESPAERGPELHGVQFWIALPEAHRQTDPAFEHHAEVPRARHGDIDVAVIMGQLGEQRSPATTFSPLVGAELVFTGAGQGVLPLNPEHEHALMLIDGSLDLPGHPGLATGALHYLGGGRDELPLVTGRATRAILIGGAPLGEEILLWWNFVARDWDELRLATERWNRNEYFGEVAAYRGGRLSAPALP